MAIYYLDVKTIGGNSCRSAVGAAAYHSGKILNDGNITHDFTRKSEIVYNQVMLPKHAPEAYRDSSVLWNAAVKAERNHNARTGREIVVALPNELTTEQQIKLIQDYVQRNFVDKGMCADFSIHLGHIHEKKGEIYPFQDLTIRKDNPHAHIQLTVRPLNKDGTWGEKSKKEYILDKNGDRIKLPSGNWKSRKIELTDWDKTETLLRWREDWSVTVNREFERLGIDARISHLSLKEQGINREPTKHMGHKAWILEKKGIKTKIGNENRVIMKRNAEKQITPETVAESMHELKQRYVILDKEANELKQKAANAQREISILQHKSEQIEERAEQIRATKEKLDELMKERQGIGFFKSKKTIDEQIRRLEHSHEQAISFFKRNYSITPEESAAEIKRIEYEEKDWELEYERLQGRLTPLMADKDTFMLEYQKKKLLAEINPDGQKIQDRLKQLVIELHLHESPYEKTARLQSERNIDVVTKRNFERILEDLSPEQAESLNKLREYEKERKYERL